MSDRFRRKKTKHWTSQVPPILEIHLGDAQWIPGLKLLTGILGNPIPSSESFPPMAGFDHPRRFFEHFFIGEKPQAPPKKKITHVTGSGRFHQTSQGLPTHLYQATRTIQVSPAIFQSNACRDHVTQIQMEI